MKYAICNELFEDWTFQQTCATVARLGYAGLEVAPFTLAPLVTEISAQQRSLFRRIARDAGLEIIGLHWLLAKTEGFHINSPDPDVRERTANYLREIVHCCADLGGNVLVFGSPAARKILPGVSMADAYEFAAETFASITDVLAERDVYLAIEPLSPKETEFLQTAAEGDRLRRMIDHPHVQLHLDVKAMSSESIPIPQLIHQHRAATRHFHANDPNLLGPGMGDVAFEPIFTALKETGYAGWVSVEVFDFRPGAEVIAQQSIEYMQQIAGNVGL